MRTSYLGFYCFPVLMAVTPYVHAQASQGMQTYSPYTPEQLREFNTQPIFPVEGPMGPVGPGAQILSPKKSSIHSKYFSQPEGEEEAESLETESAEPYQPMQPVITF
jgi:hypothetical protein